MHITVRVDKTKLKITGVPWSITFTYLEKGRDQAYLKNLHSLQLKFPLRSALLQIVRLGQGGRHEWLGSLTLQVLLHWIKSKISFIPAATINQSMMHLVTPCPRGTSVSAKDYIKFLWCSYTLGWTAIYALCNTDQCIYTNILNTAYIFSMSRLRELNWKQKYKE